MTRQQRFEDAELVLRVLCAVDEQRAGRACPDRSEDAKELWNACRSWLDQSSVRGLAVGTRSRDGRQLSGAVLTVLVERKLSSDDVSFPIPPKLKVPGTRRWVQTDVEGIGYGGVTRDERFGVHRRPAPAGAPVRRARDDPGTFACLLREQGGKRLFLLSNAHVLAFAGATEGRVYQPHYTPSYDAVIGELTLAIPVEVSAHGYPNSADAAVAEVADAGLVSPEVHKVGYLSGIGRRPKRGDRVAKFGPASGFRSADVLSASATVEVAWVTPVGEISRAGFCDVVRCGRYAIAGDSGSAVVNTRRELVGLHFASFDFESFFVPIETVLDSFREHHALDLSLVTEQQR